MHEISEHIPKTMGYYFDIILVILKMNYMVLFVLQMFYDLVMDLTMMSKPDVPCQIQSSILHFK